MSYLHEKLFVLEVDCLWLCVIPVHHHLLVVSGQPLSIVVFHPYRLNKYVSLNLSISQLLLTCALGSGDLDFFFLFHPGNVAQNRLSVVPRNFSPVKWWPFPLALFNSGGILIQLPKYHTTHRQS